MKDKIKSITLKEKGSTNEEILSMKIATYNIWNSDEGMPYRSKYIVNEIQNVKADIICLQEVHNRKLAENIAISVGYQYWYFANYSNDEEGLCILSHIPFEECDSWLNDSNAIYCSFLHEGKKVSVINVHLPWDSVAERERQIVSIVNAAEKNNMIMYIWQETLIAMIALMFNDF